ncbi:MAG: serine/threonine-protein kinase [Polyangiales bacterium]
MKPIRDSTSSVFCVHCRETHPRVWTHCPNSGKPMQAGDPRVGSTVASRYRIESIIGRGGMGIVYGARRSTGERVAVKCLHPEIADNADAIRRFQREAETARSVRHPNVVEVLEAGVDGGSPYIVMEYLDGEPLSTRLTRAQTLSPHVACQLMHQALLGLAAVHRAGVIHRDLKPGNIFLSFTPRGEIRVKLLDFGVSMWSDFDLASTKLTRTGVLMGTPSYMSPEQARGNPRFDQRADLYSVAAMLYECIAGHVPHVRSNYHALLLAIVEGNPPPLEACVAVLPRGLSAVVHRGLAVNPDVRYADADAFAGALEPFLTLTRASSPPRLATSAASQFGVSPARPSPPADEPGGDDVAVRSARDSSVFIARDLPATAEPSVSQTVSMGAMRYLQAEFGPAAVAELLTRLPSAHARLLIDGAPNLRCPASVCDALLNEAEIEFGAGAMSVSRAIGAEIATSAATRTLRWVRTVSPAVFVTRVPDVWADLFDFGSVSVMTVGSTRCRIDVMTTLAECAARDAMMCGLFARLLTITGATAVDVYSTGGLERGSTIYRAGWQAT